MGFLLDSSVKTKIPIFFINSLKDTHQSLIYLWQEKKRKNDNRVDDSDNGYKNVITISKIKILEIILGDFLLSDSLQVT